MTVRAAARASELVPPRRFSMARGSVFTVIMSLHPAPGVIWAPVAFIGLPDCGRKGRPPSPVLWVGLPRTHIYFIETEYCETPFKPSRGPRPLERFHATAVRESDRWFGQGAPGRPFQRRVRLREPSREVRVRTRSTRQEPRDLERRDLAGRA